MVPYNLTVTGRDSTWLVLPGRLKLESVSLVTTKTTVDLVTPEWGLVREETMLLSRVEAEGEQPLVLSWCSEVEDAKLAIK